MPLWYVLFSDGRLNFDAIAEKIPPDRLEVEGECEERRDVAEALRECMLGVKALW